VLHRVEVKVEKGRIAVRGCKEAAAPPCGGDEGRRRGRSSPVVVGRHRRGSPPRCSSPLRRGRRRRDGGGSERRSDGRRSDGQSRGRRSRLAGWRRSGGRRRGGGCAGGGGAGDGGARRSLGWGRLKHPPRMRLSGGLLQNAGIVAAAAGAATVLLGSAFCKCRSICSICWRRSKQAPCEAAGGRVEDMSGQSAVATVSCGSIRI
jgi:hypothetical protein